MSPGAPAYHRPRSLEEALSLLASAGPDARPLAGGQDLTPLVTMGRVRPAAIIDLTRLPGLSGIDRRHGRLALGALVIHRDVARASAGGAACRLLAAAAERIGGGLQVRNRGTVGGALCAAHPAYDYAAPLVAADAEVVLASAGGRRRVRAEEFFIAAGTTAIAPGELLVEVVLDELPATAGVAYEKLTFTEGCYAIASAACVVTLTRDGGWETVHLALGAVSGTPVRLRALEARLLGRGPSDVLPAEVAAAAEAAVRDPLDDALADGEYRRAMAGVVAARALARATRDAAAAAGAGT